MENLKALTEAVCCVAREAGHFLKEERKSFRREAVNVDYARLQNCCLADAEFPNTYLEGAYTGGSVYDRSGWDDNTGMIIRQ